MFRGRGDYFKMGMLKRRILLEDVIINCSRCGGRCRIRFGGERRNLDVSGRSYVFGRVGYMVGVLL